MPLEAIAKPIPTGRDQVEVLLDVLKELTGITIPLQKKTMVMFRLRKRFAEFQDLTVPQYAAVVRRNKQEQQLFINLLTTNETSFFRTARVWNYFRQEFLTQFVSSQGSETLRAWSAASSTGEEATSLAMACHDMQLRHPNFRFQIVATDVDTDVLAKAESGEFCSRTVEKLRESHPEMYQRHFKTAGTGFHTVDATIKRSIRFMPHNLMDSPRLSSPQDIVFLRNVLIYFEEKEKKHIINKIGSAMKPGAILVLGESESLSTLSQNFTFIQPQIYRRTS